MRKENILIHEEWKLVFDAYKNSMPIDTTTDYQLRMVVEEAVSNPGGLVRGQLAFKVLTTHQISQDIALTLATAIEYFHTASLILDDLPCMDDATMRRARVCAHKKHGEAKAILGALALINRSYALLWSSIDSLSSKIRGKATEEIESCLGIAGIINGQANDLSFQSLKEQESLNEDETTKIAVGKTVSMMRLALVLPGIISEVSKHELHHLERVALFWGLAYQIIDDYQDIFSNPMVTGKTTQKDSSLNRPNFVLENSLEEQQNRLERLMFLLGVTISKLENYNYNWSFIRFLQEYLEQGLLIQQKSLCA